MAIVNDKILFDPIDAKDAHADDCGTVIAELIACAHVMGSHVRVTGQPARDAARIQLEVGLIEVMLQSIQLLWEMVQQDDENVAQFIKEPLGSDERERLMLGILKGIQAAKESLADLEKRLSAS